MKIIFFSITIIITAFFIQAESLAQTKMLSGEVFTFDSIPLINANIKVKSTKQEVKTDANGRFTAECASKDVLTVSANGFYSQKVKLEEESGNLNVKLKLKAGDKNVDAAIDNGHVSNTESFKVLANKINSGEDFSQYNNIYEIIQGKFAGVQVVNGEIFIRGGSSGSNNAALVVVDGVISNSTILTDLPTSLVKKVSIIKDGNTALYGSQGANGVVLVETKRAENY